MLAVRDGDVERIGVLFDRHHRMLFNFFLRLTTNRGLSEDLVQEVFFRMIRRRLNGRKECASRSSASACPIVRNTILRSSPVDSSSAWRWRGRWPENPQFYWRTSPPEIWIRRMGKP